MMVTQYKDITAFKDMWYKNTHFHKERESMHGIKVILKKTETDFHVVVFLSGVEKVPSRFKYGDNSFLVYASLPKNSDGTEEDARKKIDEAVRKAEEIYESISDTLIHNLWVKFEEYENVVKEIYDIKNMMSDKYVE